MVPSGASDHVLLVVLACYSPQVQDFHSFPGLRMSFDHTLGGMTTTLDHHAQEVVELRSQSSETRLACHFPFCAFATLEASFQSR